jgi:hypothetical protein
LKLLAGNKNASFTPNGVLKVKMGIEEDEAGSREIFTLLRNIFDALQKQ